MKTSFGSIAFRNILLKARAHYRQHHRKFEG